MGSSLQDQLVQAGLVSEEQLRTARKPPRPKAKRKRPGRGDRRPAQGRASGPDGAERSPAATAAPTQPSGPPPLEARNARIRALLDRHRMNDEAADVPYNFTRENRIKKIYVTAEQRAALLDGTLAVAGYRRVHHVIPAAVAAEIQSLRPEVFVHRAGDGAGEAPAGDEHPVPNDLVW